MSKYFFTILLLATAAVVLSDAYKTTHLKEETVLIRPRRESSDDNEKKGKDTADGNNQGLIATYWNNFLKRARLPLPSWNITNPLSNLFTPYVVEVDYPPENSKPQEVIGQQHLILLDPATNQYYKVQPVPS